MIIPTFGDRRAISVGLLGGSFNPAHQGHLQLAHFALVHLKLDQVWLMVSPGNPLKPDTGMASFAVRLESAHRLVDHRRIVATDIEERLGKRYTIDTVSLLQKRFPNVRFVWIMGADGLVTLPKWRKWRLLSRIVPIVVVPRPGCTPAALGGAATSVMRHLRVPARQASVLSTRKAGAWAFLLAPENHLSATALREVGALKTSSI